MKNLSPSERGEQFKVPLLDADTAVETLTEIKLSENPDSTDNLKAPAAFLPKNAFTGEHYSGRNIDMLIIAAFERHFTTQSWATLKQWNKLGFSVVKGQSGTLIAKYEEYQKTVDGKEVTYGYKKAAYVFNRDQVAERPSALKPDHLSN